MAEGFDKSKRKFSHDKLRVNLNRSKSHPGTNQEMNDMLDGNPLTPVNVEEEGKELFLNFLRRDIAKEGYDDPGIMQMVPDGYQDPKWKQTGCELRMMADAFAKSKERQKIRKRAQEVSMDSFSKEQFLELLNELLENGVTKEKILVLFIFCSDLALRFIAKKALDLFEKLMSWAIQYITDKVCEWVFRHGGWDMVFRSACDVFNTAVTVLASAMVVWWIYRWVRRTIL